MSDLLTWEQLWVKWVDKLLTLVFWALILGWLGWFAQQSYYDYLKAGLLKAGTDKETIEKLFK